MKNKIPILILSLITLFGLSLTVTAAQATIINLLGNDTAQINCNGSLLVLERQNKTRATATCRPNATPPTPTPTPIPAPNQLAVIKFVLVNADTNQDIGPLTDGVTINLASLPTENVNVRAETQPATVGSVVFALNGNNKFSTENIPPYALAGDNSGNYNPSTFGIGQYKLTATPYKGSNGTGAKGTALNVTFTVIDEDSEPGPSDPPQDDPPSDDPPQDDPPSDDPPQDNPPSDNQPSASTPLCEEHDPNAWHPLYDAQKDCHYDHEHKHDPNEVNDIFGPPGEWFGGGSMSYPWQTFTGASGNYSQWDGNQDSLENVAKHRVYGWIVRRDIPRNGSNMWIKDFRVQFHAVNGIAGVLTRYHSFSLEAQLCKASGGCGIVRTGGWLDFGNLQVSDFGVVPLPGQEDAISKNDRRRIHYYIENPADYRYGAHFFWYGRNAPPEPDDAPVLHPLIAVASGDFYLNVDPNNPQALTLFCPDFRCKWNGSTIQAHVVELTIRSRFDPDGDGYADFIGYTDRYGEIDRSCNSVALDCIPLIMKHVPVGNTQYRDDNFGLGPEGLQDFDTSPPGVWWITYPN